jgi:hypothetical protein
MKLLCFKCLKEVATAQKVNGLTTWFAVCSECLFGVKGWTTKDIKEFQSSQVSPQKQKKKRGRGAR